jgi:hypothetical protein
MTMEYEAQVFRYTATFTRIGSIAYTYVKHGGIVVCDVSPETDLLVQAPEGQQESGIYILHFPPGTDIDVRDAILITKSKTGFGRVGQTFYMNSILLPSETTSYMRMRAVFGKDPMPGVA